MNFEEKNIWKKVLKVYLCNVWLLYFYSTVLNNWSRIIDNSYDLIYKFIFYFNADVFTQKVIPIKIIVMNLFFSVVKL